MIQLLSIKNQLEQLTIKQQEEILKLLNKLNISYSENNNGIFFNLSNLNNDQLKELEQYIEYTKDQEKTLQKIENVKDELTKVYFNNLKETQSSNISEVNESV